MLSCQASTEACACAALGERLMASGLQYIGRGVGDGLKGHILEIGAGWCAGMGNAAVGSGLCHGMLMSRGLGC